MSLRTIMHVVRTVLTPGSPEHKANMERLQTQERRLLSALQFVELPASQDLKAASDAAAEF